MIRPLFIWSIHKTRAKAEASLESDLASGDVFLSEFAGIEKRGDIYVVLLWDQEICA